jgi:hypothetical protein
MRDAATYVIALAIALLSARWAFAGTPADTSLSNPPAEAIHDATLDVGVRAVLAKTTESFLAKLKDTEENPTGMLSPPSSAAALSSAGRSKSATARSL